jgi:hypothetical protein
MKGNGYFYCFFLMIREIGQYIPLDNNKKAIRLSGFICIPRGLIYKTAECMVIY